MNNKFSVLSRFKKVDAGPTVRQMEEGVGEVVWWWGGYRGVGSVLCGGRGEVVKKVVSWNARELGGLEKRREGR